jgi:hypothetical protein
MSDLQSKSKQQLNAELEEIGKVTETHALDCQCTTCERFMAIMDEFARRNKAYVKGNYPG